jgi:prepilin peptidase CpaA
MGALGAWLGFKLTFYLIIASLVMVVIDGLFVVMYRVIRGGAKNFKKQYLATGKTDAKGKAVFAKESKADKQKRRMLPFAVPVAMATWLVMLVNAVGIIHGGQLGPDREPKSDVAQARSDSDPGVDPEKPNR